MCYKNARMRYNVSDHVNRVLESCQPCAIMSAARMRYNVRDMRHTSGGNEDADLYKKIGLYIVDKQNGLQHPLARSHSLGILRLLAPLPSRGRG